jgi:hypothetical protein
MGTFTADVFEELAGALPLMEEEEEERVEATEVEAAVKRMSSSWDVRFWK